MEGTNKSTPTTTTTQEEEEEEHSNSNSKQKQLTTVSKQQGGDADEEEEEKYRGWKAMPYVIGNETFEKLGTVGTTANLLVYLTTVYGMKGANAATLLNLFGGTTNLAPLLGAFLSDTYLGRYATLAYASVASFLGMLLLTLTAAVPSLHPRHRHEAEGPSAPQLAVLLASFALIAVGAGGIRPCNLAFGADQFDPRTPAGRRGIASFFNWYYFTFTVAMMVSATLIIYLQTSVSWPLGLAVPAALMALSCALFFMGTRLYVRVRPEGSPFTSFARVLAAAFRNRHLPRPRQGPADLFDPPHRSSLVTKLAYTDQFRCLDKAALLVAPSSTRPLPPPPPPAAACTLQQVEEVKCLARLLPLWSSGIVYFIVLTNLGNYAVLQAMQTDRRIGRSGFQVPAGSLVVFNMLALTAWIPLYDRFLVPALRRATGLEGGVTQLQRIGAGIALSVATMLVSAAVERHRRRAGDATPFSVLVPQQLLAGLSEAFAMIGQVELYYKQFPENMRSVAGALLFLGLAVASYASGLMVAVVHRTTDWLPQDLNRGRVDLYYLVIAAMAAVNMLYFLACARWYRFSKPDAGGVVELDGLKPSNKNGGPPV